MFQTIITFFQLLNIPESYNTDSFFTKFMMRIHPVGNSINAILYSISKIKWL